MSQSSQFNSGSDRLNWSALLRVIEEENRHIQQLISSGPIDGYLHEEIEIEGRLWHQMRIDHRFMESTNFTEAELQSIWYDMQSFIEEAKTRGPPPKVCHQDAFLCTLIWYKLGFNYDELATFTHLPTTTMRSAMNRIHSILLKTLEKRWEKKPRPVPLTTTNYPYIGLMVDTTSIEVFRPVGRFEEAKIYWNTKHSMYSLKSEVAVMATPPHYALFVQKAQPGSIHDYTIFKQTADSYAAYLQKNTQEKQAIPSDGSNNRWAILGDRGYTGPERDTPTVRRLFIQRNAITQEQQSRNAELAAIRVVVEQWFGRLKKLWKFARTVYKLDHSEFDSHFLILSLLTNEHIRVNNLTEEDRIYYLNLLKEQRERYEQRRRKRHAQAEKYREKKRQRIQSLE